MNSTTELRLQLLANGYSPIRNHDKRTFMKGWPDVELTPAEIESWDRMRRDQATGLRVENGLSVIDFDINDKEAMDMIADRIFERIPELGDPNANLLVRHGKGFKEAWFVRTDEAFGRLHSRAWTRPGEGVDAGTHRVEIFGGSSPRQFGAFGPHTVRDDGTVAVEYRWSELSPLDVPQRQLPLLTKLQQAEMCDISEEVMIELGWQLVEKSTKGENDAVRVYDLTEDMQFDLLSGDRLSLQQLRELAATGTDGIRCSASFLEGVAAVNRSRCLVTVTRAGNLAIWESASGVTHCEASLKPKEYAVDINRIMEKLNEANDRRNNRIKTTDDVMTAAAKLVRSFAYCASPVPMIYPLWAKSADEALTPLAMRMRMLPNCDEETGPRGGVRRVNPFDLFMGSEARIEVAGARMRPDKERPTYEEDGKLWLNVYTPPEHAAKGGSPEGGKALLVQMIPDEGERHWFTQWMAHKVRYPYIPGPAVIMVARKFGTGRGTLGVLFGKLLGPDYVTSLPFHMFAGKSYQSQYDDWGAEALMAIVSEAAETGEGSKYTAKADTYMHIKALVEPRAIMRKYVSKKQHFKALSFTTYLIATNDIDALPLPGDDRRFAVISNGDPAPPEFWTEFNLWMDNAANVAAFHEWLSEYSLEGYSPYEAPPRTEAQATMAMLGRSDIDRCVDEALTLLKGEVYTPDQIVELVRKIAAMDSDVDLPEHGVAKIVRREAIKRGYRVGVPGGTNWQPLVAGKRVGVYAVTRALANKWRLDAHLREELLKNQPNERLGTVLPFKRD